MGFDWKENKDLIGTLALEARGGDEEAESLLLVSVRRQPEFINYAQSKSRYSSLLASEDLLQMLTINTWKAIFSKARDRWEEDRGMDFPYWVLRLWNHSMQVEFNRERAKKRMPSEGFVYLDSQELSKEVLDLIFLKSAKQPDVIAKISVDRFLKIIEEDFGEELKGVCKLLMEGATRADVAKLLYPNEPYFKRWMRAHLLFKDLQEAAKLAGLSS